MALVAKPILSHEAILFWSENLTRKQFTAAILLLVCNDMRFFRFAHFSHGKIKVSVRSLNICLDSIHVLYISIEFLAANYRCELETKLVCSVRKQNI